jgi:hypothetical protein
LCPACHVCLAYPSDGAEPIYHNKLTLVGHYRNKIAHVFFREGLYAMAMYACAARDAKVTNADLLSEVRPKKLWFRCPLYNISETDVIFISSKNTKS